MKTIIDPFLGKTPMSYFYASMLDKQTSAMIENVQQEISARFPNVLSLQSSDALHITVLHLFSPDAVYPESQDVLYERIRAEADEVMKQAVAGLANPLLEHGTLEASPGAIIVKWRDDGTFDEVRSRFTARFDLHEGTRRPPKIVHTTIARYLNSVPLEPIQEFLKPMKLKVSSQIPEFQLYREAKLYLSDYQVLKRYKFAG